MNIHFVKSFRHYYGDAVRIIFTATAVIVLFGLPELSYALKVPANAIVFMAIGLVVAAGISNPLQRWSMALNIIVSLCGVVLFARASYLMHLERLQNFYLLLNQVLAALFVFALYLSVKTYRGDILNRRILIEEVT